MNFSTGYPETEAQNFIVAVIKTGWILEFISVLSCLQNPYSHPKQRKTRRRRSLPVFNRNATLGA